MSQSEATKLSVIIPTFRFDDTARAALAAAAAAAGSDIGVHIGDNSENIEKHAFLKNLAKTNKNVFVYCHEKNIGGDANFLFLLETQKSPFVCYAADDDVFAGPYYRAGMEIISSRDDCSAACGLFISTTYRSPLTQPILIPALSRIETTALQRIEAYKGTNTIAYAVMKSPVAKGFFKYMAMNPLKAGFVDYLMAFHILSMGAYIVDQQSYAYVYNNNNWAFTDTSWHSGAKFYQEAGLPEIFQYFHRLHWAVANLHFFSSTFRSPDLSEAEAGEIGAYLFFRCLLEFKTEYITNKPRIDAILAPCRPAIDALNYLLDTKTASDPEIYKKFLLIVAAFSYETGLKYRDFLISTLIKNI